MIKNFLLIFFLLVMANCETLTFSGSISGTRTVGTSFNFRWLHSYSTTTNVNIDLYTSTTKVKTMLTNQNSLNTTTNTLSLIVPDAVQGADYRIRVISATNTSVWAQSDTFSINTVLGSSISVGTIPTLSPGSARTLTWSITGGIKPVRIDLYGGDVFIRNIVERTSALSYAWTVPSSLVVGSTYKIKISAIDEPNIKGTRTFAITDATSKSINSVSRPTNGQKLFKGESTTIQWTTSGMSNTDKVRIDLFNDTTYNRAIATDVSATSSYTWIVPQNAFDSTTWRVKVAHQDLSHLQATSNPFTVATPLGAGTTSGVIAVAANEFSSGFTKSWRLTAPVGKCFELTFDSFTTTNGDSLKVYNGENNAFNSLGTFSGSGHEIGKKIQTTGRSLYARFDVATANSGLISISYISIDCGAPSLTFTSPLANAVYTAGAVIPVRWISEGSYPFSTLTFRKGTTIMSIVAENAVSPRNFQLPTSSVFGTDYNFHISSIDPSLPQYSTSFTVYPTKSISIVTPSVRNATYLRSQNVTVSWTSAGNFSTVSVALRKGASVISTVASTPTTSGTGGSYIFTIPAAALLGNDYTFTVSNGGTTATSVVFSIQSTCSSDIILSTLGQSGTIALTSSQYTYNLNCRSTISSTSKNCIRTVFTSFSLGDGDKITLYDGDATSSKILKQYASNSTDSAVAITSPGFISTIRTTTTSSGAYGNGYSVTYTSVACTATLDVLTPSGKSRWTKGENSYVVQWNSTNLASNVKIVIAAVGSAVNTSLVTLSSSVSSSIGYFTGFTIPASLTDFQDYAVRVISVDSPDFYAKNTFTVLPTSAPKIIVTKPTHLTTVNRRDNILVEWTSAGVGASHNVKIDLYAGTEFVRSLATVNSTVGTNSYTLLDTYCTSERYRVYVIATSVSGMVGESPLFKVNQNNAATLAISKPTADEFILADTLYLFEWTKTGLVDNVNILLYTGGVYVKTIASALNATTINSYNYTFVENPGQYTLYVVRAEGLDVLSTQNFYILSTLSEGSITVLKPYANSVLSIETTTAQPITWSWVGYVARVNIDLLFKLTTVESLAVNITNTGSYSGWVLPYNKLPYGVDYSVRVTEVANITNWGTSSSFIITAASSTTITVSSPAAGVSWPIGSSQSIVWAYGNAPTITQFLDIELFSGGRLYKRIAHQTPVSGNSYTWLLPTDLELYKPYRILIFASRSRVTLGQSATFTVTRSFTTVGVSGSSNMFLGNDYSASWTGNTPYNFEVTLLDSTNNSRLWNLAKKVTSTSYKFYPPTSLSADATTNYKVRVHEISNTGWTGVKTVTERATCKGIKFTDAAGTINLPSGATANMRCDWQLSNPNNLCYLFQYSAMSGIQITDSFSFYEGHNANGELLSKVVATNYLYTPLIKTNTPNALVTFTGGSGSSQAFTLRYRSIECSSPVVTVDTPSDIQESQVINLRWNVKSYINGRATISIRQRGTNTVHRIVTVVYQAGFYRLTGITVSSSVELYATVFLQTDNSEQRQWGGASGSFFLKGDIRITNPLNTLVTRTTGSSLGISWTNTLENNGVNVYLFGVTGTTYTNLATIRTGQAGSSVSTSYAIPDTIAVHDKYVVRIQPTSPTSYFKSFYQSDPIVIRRKTQLIKLVSVPASSSIFVAGQTHNIRWTSVGEFSEVTIDLLFATNSTRVARIASIAPNNGAYAWTIPAQYTDLVTQYKIRISPARLTQKSTIRADSAVFTFKALCTSTSTSTTGSSTYTPTSGTTAECYRIIAPTGNPNCVRITFTISTGSRDSVKIYNGVTTASPLILDQTGSATKIISAYGPILYVIKTDSTTGLSVAGSWSTVCATNLVVNSPSRFGFWKVGTAQNIQFTHILPTATVLNVTLHKGAVDTAVLASVTTTATAGSEYDGRIAWTIPAGLVAGNDYYLRFQQLPSSAQYAIHLADSHRFSISTTDAKFAITAPAAFTTWTIPTTQTISWTTAGAAVANVNIDLYSGGRSLWLARIASGISNTGSHGWAIPEYLHPGLDYHIVVSNSLNVQEHGATGSLILSEGNKGSLAFTQQPVGATVNTNIQITWSKTTAADIPWTDVLLYSGGRPHSILNSNYLGTSVNVTISAPGTDYQIVLVSGSNVNVRASSSLFTITEGTPVNTKAIYVGSPGTGDTWWSRTTQSSYTIKWVWSGTIANVNIELFHSTNATSGSYKIAQIATNVENNGWYSWTVPSNVLHSKRYVVKVTDATAAAVTGVSGEFSILSGISNNLAWFAVETGSQSLGVSRKIRWIPDSSSKVVDLYYGHERYVIQQIANNIPNDGHYTWQLPKKALFQWGEILVVPHGSETAPSHGASYFTLYNPTKVIGITLTTYFTSVSLGKQYTIGWTLPASDTHTTTHVHIDLHYNGGDLVQSIACDVPTNSTGSYTWTPTIRGLLVAADSTKNYQIRVYSSSTVGYQGRGNSFKIRQDVLLTGDCGQILINSGSYLANLDKTWSISSNSASNLGCIRFYFKDMKLLSGHSVTIYDSSELDTSKDIIFSGSTTPAAFQIYANKAIVRFRTTSTILNAVGFDLQWAHVECSSRIIITSPPAAVIGESATVTWTCSGKSDKPLTIKLRSNSREIRDLTTTVLCSAQTFTYTIPTDIHEGDLYSYEISRTDSFNIIAFSSTFSINVKPRFLHTSGMTLLRGQTVKISWTSYGIIKNGITLRIRNSVTGSTSLTQSYSRNDGFGNIVVPSISMDDCDYNLVMELIAGSNNLVTTASIPIYICAANTPSIKVLTPSFYPLNIGTKQVVQYNSHAVKLVDIWLKTDDEAGTGILQLANHTTASGLFVANIPTSLVLGRNYYITVQDALVNNGVNSSFCFTAVKKKCEYTTVGTFGNLTLPAVSQGFKWDLCNWKIQNSCNSTIRFTLSNEAIQSCETIKLYDGPSINSTLLATYTGGSGSGAIIDTTTRDLYVRFETCNYLTSNTGSILSSGFVGEFSSLGCRNQISGVLRPTRISNVVVGKPYKIRWLAQSGSGLAHIQLIQNGAISSVVTSNLTTSNYWWTPTTAGTGYQIRVSRLSDPTNWVDSGIFSVTSMIDNGIFSVVSPATVKQATSYVVDWTSNITSKIDIDLYRGAEFIKRLAYKTKNNKTTVLIPWAPPSEFYRFILSDSYSGRFIESDSFSITPNTPSIVVNSQFGYRTQEILHGPQWNGLEGKIRWTNNLIFGRQYLIRWTAPVGFTESENIEIGIISDSVLLNSAIIPGGESEYWYTIPAITQSNYGKHNKYQFYIFSVYHRAIYGLSPTFTISPSTATSLCPVVFNEQIKLTMDRQTFPAANVLPITWTTIGNIPYVTLSVTNDLGEFIAELGGGCIPNNGLYHWTVPIGLRGRYIINIGAVNSTIPATRDTFQNLDIRGIKQTIAFTSPIAGDIWFANDTAREITWDNNIQSSLAIPSHVQIFANGILITNTSGGVVLNTPNTGSYVWDISAAARQIGRAAHVNNFTLDISGSVMYQNVNYDVKGKSDLFYIRGARLNAASSLSSVLSLTILCSLIAVFFA